MQTESSAPENHTIDTTAELFVELAATTDPTVEIAYISNYSDNIVTREGDLAEQDDAAHCIIDDGSDDTWIVFGSDSPNRNEGEIVINGRYVGGFMSAVVK
jgi:hypothetical protein